MLCFCFFAVGAYTSEGQLRFCYRKTLWEVGAVAHPSRSGWDVVDAPTLGAVEMCMRLHVTIKVRFCFINVEHHGSPVVHEQTQ